MNILVVLSVNSMKQCSHGLSTPSVVVEAVMTSAQRCVAMESHSLWLVEELNVVVKCHTIRKVRLAVI